MKNHFGSKLALVLLIGGLLSGCTMGNEARNGQLGNQKLKKVNNGVITAEKTGYHTDLPSSKAGQINYKKVNQAGNMDGQAPNAVLPGGQDPLSSGYSEVPYQNQQPGTGTAPEQQPNSGQQTPQQQPQGEEMGSFEKRVIELTNAERKKNGLQPLAADSSLANVAQEKSDDMEQNNYFSHTSPTYGSPFEMMKRFGENYQTAGENIAQGQQTPEEVVDAWMKSEGHRENIMNSEFTNIGIGYTKDGNYWSQMFIGK
ncbi:CAP domain-containing protein [Metabacillus sp. GX 13764]|uniref:CAP domain-containing protein n=1 Tax=Metabacillus kandeliae TaxID=2900151 RepID=UPI001E4EC5C1|nr:CAP domain-containing protein [Metabacillus kandeliae]MCD7035949.1 CAP domain-containing protein [Metabacillus kandeliae]